MSHSSSSPQLPSLETLLAAERELVPALPDVRHRVIERARASLPRGGATRLVTPVPRRRRLRLGELAAAAIVLSTLCALAYLAGYHAKQTSGAPAVGSAPVAASTVVVLTVAAPVPSADAAPPAADATDLAASAARPAAAPRPLSASESYALELGVLQPAQRAVARGEFARALGPIAEHQRRFPSGRLAEEREALRVKALVGLGRTGEAQRAGAAFRERFPRSALVEPIDTLVDGGK